MIKHQPRKAQLANILSYQRLSEKEPNIKRLVTQAQQISEIETLFINALPENQRPYFKVNGICGSCLNLTCSSAAIKMRFNMTQQQTLQAIQRHLALKHINQFKIKIRPNIVAEKEHKQVKPISSNNANLLLLEAEETNDPKLKAVLQKLARQED